MRGGQAEALSQQVGKAPLALQGVCCPQAHFPVQALLNLLSLQQECLHLEQRVKSLSTEVEALRQQLRAALDARCASHCLRCSQRDVVIL